MRNNLLQGEQHLQQVKRHAARHPEPPVGRCEVGGTQAPCRHTGGNGAGDREGAAGQGIWEGTSLAHADILPLGGTPKAVIHRFLRASAPTVFRLAGVSHTLFRETPAQTRQDPGQDPHLRVTFRRRKKAGG